MRRSLIIWTIYCAILVLAVLSLRQMWQAHYNNNLLIARQEMGDSVKQVEALISTANSHVNMLRVSAVDSLEDQDGADNVSRFFHHIVPAPQIGGYCSGIDRHIHQRPIVAISGLGEIPKGNTPLGSEINMALMLNPQFSATAENIGNMVRAYYTSARHFIVLYPAVSCAEFHFADDLLDREFFRFGMPKGNPMRRLFWTEAYMDEAGKGLMTTVGAPVYDGEQFLGTVAIDLALQVLSQHVRNPGIGVGTAFIVNDRGQLLAHPTLINSTDTKAHLLWEVFGPANSDPMKVLQQDPPRSFVDHGSKLVYSQAFRGAPWRYVYITDRVSLLWQAVLDSKLEIAGFLMLAMMIAAFEKARLSGIKFRTHAEALQLTQKELHRARDRAQVAEAAARQANRAKSVMLANASHDLRTPLNAIIGFSELILSKLYGPIGSAKYEDYLRDIHASGNLLLSIIDNVLDLSKVEAGRYEMNEEDIQILPFLDASSRLVSTQAAHSHIALSLHVQPDLPALWADRRALQQIVLNLLSNAIKFTANGGKVEIRALRSPEGGLRIEVKDNGQGISDEDQAMLFRPFSRGASANTAHKQGTGLGLSIVKSMIELHGGSVDLTSELGHGTTVTLNFPASRLGKGTTPIAA